MIILMFSMGVTRKDNIWNEHIRGVLMVDWLGQKDRETRLRWYTLRDVDYVSRKALEIPEVYKHLADIYKQIFYVLKYLNIKKSTLSGRNGVEMSPSPCESFP